MRGKLFVTVLLLLGCVRFHVFECGGEDDRCVLEGELGRCEQSGYCSFPDSSCGDDGHRYSMHAPPDLAHECVVPEDAADTETSTGPDDSGGSGGIPGCVDLDGDGAGLGADCAAEDCDDDNPAVSDGCFYLAPDGNDDAAGTRDAPWQTFAHAVAALAPGDSLVVLDGIYLHDVTGGLRADCTASASSGTQAAPIFVRALHDRQAVLDRGAATTGIQIAGCEYWRVRGLSIVGADAPSDEGGAWAWGVSVNEAREIELRGLFVSHANRYFNEHTIHIANSEDVLLEEVEAHDFFRSGFSFYKSDRITCRRCYGNSHDVADLPACPDLPDCSDPAMVGTADCPKCSAGSPSRGDSTFFVEGCKDVSIENSVSEGSARGFHLLGGVGLDGALGGGVVVRQSISIDDDIALDLRGSSGGVPPREARVEDFVAIAPREDGVRIESPDGLDLRHVTVLGAGGDGITLESVEEAQCTAGACSLHIQHVLVLDAAGTGISISVAPDTWSLDWANVFGSGAADYDYPGLATDPFDDEAGDVRSCRSEPATLVGLEADACRAYVPTASNMHDIAGDGLDIGGNVTDLLVDGVPTGAALWSQEFGFPCGPDPLAPAQVQGEACPDLVDRAGVGTDACPAPAPRG